MWSQRITWTALPWGHDERGRPRLSAFASLRLDPGPEPAALSSFPDVEAWADLIARTSFGAIAEVAGEPAIELATEVLSAAPDGRVFELVLPGTSPIAAFEFVDHSVRPVVSYGVRDVLASVEQLYGTVGAEDPERLPDATWTGNKVGPRTQMDKLLGEVGGLLGVAPAPRERAVDVDLGRRQRGMDPVLVGLGQRFLAGARLGPVMEAPGARELQCAPGASITGPSSPGRRPRRPASRTGDRVRTARAAARAGPARARGR